MTEYAQRYRTRRQRPPGRAAAVLEGQDAQGRPVLVSIVRPLDPDAFLRTAGVVASVRHLDLAPIVDAGREGSDCFVVQEDPGGTDALTLAGAGPIPVANAALMAASAAAGLAALHARGVVHGGVDPMVLVRAADGSTKLMGAGLAEAYPPPDLRPGSPPGIARYLSPEEVAGRAPSPASDVYRLGLVAYLLLTGQHAFDGVDAGTVAQEQLDAVVRPPQLLNPEVPPALAQIVMRALDKDPGARGTAAQFQADIERVLRSAEVQEVAPPPRGSRAWLWILLVVIAALIALGAVWALTRDKGGDVMVPDVTGMTQKKAASTLADAGLKTGKITRVQSGEPEGTVVAQDPAAGKKVVKSSAVDLEVSGAPQPTATPVPVPNVTGSSQANAQAQLTQAGFQVIVTQAPSDTVPAGSVVSQAPQAGVIASQGSTVSIVVSTGPTPTATPTPTSSSSP